jgi:hypothetical protein
MTGEINKEGILLVQRNEIKPQFCAFKSGEQYDYNCGDDCPLFEEQLISGKITISLNCSPQQVRIQIKKDDRK